MNFWNRAPHRFFFFFFTPFNRKTTWAREKEVRKTYDISIRIVACFSHRGRFLHAIGVNKKWDNYYYRGGGWGEGIGIYQSFRQSYSTLIFSGSCRSYLDSSFSQLLLIIHSTHKWNFQLYYSTISILFFYLIEGQFSQLVHLGGHFSTALTLFVFLMILLIFNRYFFFLSGKNKKKFNLAKNEHKKGKRNFHYITCKFNTIEILYFSEYKCNNFHYYKSYPMKKKKNFHTFLMKFPINLVVFEWKLFFFFFNKYSKRGGKLFFNKYLSVSFFFFFFWLSLALRLRALYLYCTNSLSEF